MTAMKKTKFMTAMKKTNNQLSFLQNSQSDINGNFIKYDGVFDTCMIHCCGSDPALFEKYRNFLNFNEYSMIEWNKIIHDFQ